MGNTGSVAIDVVLEGGGVVLAGSPLKGEVRIKVKKKIEGAPIMLFLSGKEKVAMREGEQSSRAERQLIKVDLPLREFHSKNRIEPGVYEFPFSVPLSRSLPSSDVYPSKKKKSNTRNASGYTIQYRILVNVGRIEKDIPFFVLSAPLQKEPVPLMVHPTFYQIKTMKLFDAGQVGLGAKLTNSHVGRGEELELVLACRNNSCAEIRSVDIKLVERLSWSTVGKKKTHREVVKALIAMKNVSLPASNVEKKRHDEVKRRKFNTNLQHATHRGIFDELKANRDPIRVPIPNFARDSFEGELVNISHHLEITIQTSLLSSDTKPTAIPLRVGTPRSPAGSISKISANPPPVAPRSLVRCPSTGSTCSSQGNPRIMATAVPAENVEKRRPSVGSVCSHDSAVPLEPIRASTTSASEKVIVLGGAALSDNRSENGKRSPIGGASAPPSFSDVAVTIPALLKQMGKSVNALDLISHHLKDERWARLFGKMGPKAFGAIVSHVRGPNQPRAAVLLAPCVLKGERFTCAFAAAGVRNTVETYRVITTQRLVPLCIDIALHSGRILKELTEWEQTVTANDFETAILAATAQQTETALPKK